MPKKFNEEDTLKFVQLYREHECLWDKRCAAYKNKEMRTSALEQLRVGMNIEELTINEVKSKIKSLRNTYYLELDKIEKSTRSGAGGSVYKPKAKWFDEYDSFVKPVSIRRKTIDIMDTPNSNEPGSSNSNDPGPSLVPRIENELENESAEETPRFTLPTKPKRSKLSQISKMINDLKEIKDNACDEETDLFGKSVSAQLKKLTEEQAVIAKEKIQSILTQCRLTDIRAKNSYSYQMQQSVQQLQNTLPTNWNSTQVLPNCTVPQYSLPTSTICPPTEPSPSTCVSSCSPNTTNSVLSPETPYNNDSHGESVDNGDDVQRAFDNA